MMKKTAPGFTLVELVIVITIVGILSIVGVPLYRTNVRKSMCTEGESLLASISMAQRMNFAKYGTYMGGIAGLTSYSNANCGFYVDARENKYFRQFTITANNAVTPHQYAATATGTGDANNITIVLQQTQGSAPIITKSGL